MAENLASKFKSEDIGYNDEKWEDAVGKFEKRLDEEVEQFHKTPESVRDPNFLNYVQRVRQLLKEWRSDLISAWQAATGYHAEQKFEDEIIQEIKFKDYSEFYDFLRQKDPADVGAQYLDRLKALKKKDPDKYADSLDLLLDQLDMFRTEPLPESEQIAPMLPPPPPLEGPPVQMPKEKTQPKTETPPAAEQPSDITQVELPNAAFETVSAPAGPSISVAAGYRQQNLPRTNVGVISDLGGLHGSQSGTSDHQSDSSDSGSGAGSVKESPVARSDSSLNMFFASLGFGWTRNPANAALGGGPFYLAETDAGVDPSSTSDPGQDGFWFNATVAGGSETSRGIAPVGNANLQSAFVFLDNSLNGGIFTLGTAGQQVKVDTDLWSLDVDARKLFPLVSGGSWQLSGGLGALVGFFNLEHDVSQFVTIAPAVNMKTRFKTHDYLVAPLFSLHLSTRSGPWFFTGEGFVAPGVLISDAEATQTFNLPPNSFKIMIDDTDNEFAVRTGAHGALELQVAPRVRVGVNGGIEYQSDVGVWRNPIILQSQPARRVFEDTFNYSVGGHVRVQWGGTPGGPN